jgi:hypothetical protein
VAQLEHHQLARRIHQVGRVEGAALGLAPRRGLLEERLVAEEPHPLLHRQILAVQPTADDEARQTHERLRELAERTVASLRRKPASIIICSQ